MTPNDLQEVVDRVEALEIADAFRGKRVLITGARGFLGRSFTAVFAALGAEVVALDRYDLAAELGAPRPQPLPNVEHVNFDVASTGGFPIYGRVDFVLPLAAIASPVHYARRALDCFDVIVNGTRSMLELAGAKGATLLLPSTSELYGDSGWSDGAMREHALGTLDPWDIRGRAYDVPKLCAEALASIFADRGVKVQTVRYFNAYGPGLARGDYRVMSRFAAAAVDGGVLEVHGAGPIPTRSFCYLTDALVGTLLVMVKGDGRPYNVGNPDEVTVEALARLIAVHAERICGKAPEIRFVDAPKAYVKQPRRRRPSIERIEGLGYKPQVALHDGVRRFLTWANEAYREGEKSK